LRSGNRAGQWRGLRRPIQRLHIVTEMGEPRHVVITDLCEKSVEYLQVNEAVPCLKSLRTTHREFKRSDLKIKNI
jgi:hypothetical protein